MACGGCRKHLLLLWPSLWCTDPGKNQTCFNFRFSLFCKLSWSLKMAPEKLPFVLFEMTAVVFCCCCCFVFFYQEFHVMPLEKICCLKWSGPPPPPTHFALIYRFPQNPVDSCLSVGVQRPLQRPRKRPNAIWIDHFTHVVCLEADVGHQSITGLLVFELGPMNLSSPLCMSVNWRTLSTKGKRGIRSIGSLQNYGVLLSWRCHFSNKLFQIKFIFISKSPLGVSRSYKRIKIYSDLFVYYKIRKH